ncbi:hypothetical protein RHGRI_004958 [Rhododendron griersonianum]|uniref:Uncharacterized protein n=1 Tax=Rhododendron griersonianum TaxID=479676 RepID=A0AAV6LBL1_9ERIC|nr:hypothetical protein RHGRI_004958 [Rhododendron griersonianum]
MPICWSCHQTCRSALSSTSLICTCSIDSLEKQFTPWTRLNSFQRLNHVLKMVWTLKKGASRRGN